MPPFRDIHLLPKIPARESTAHKGTFGTVLGIGGCCGLSGAIALAGRAALLGGAGLVRLAVPNSVQEIVASFYPEVTTIACPADRNGKFSMAALNVCLEQAQSASCVMIGPGLGRSFSLDRFVTKFLELCEKPCVVDADAINALADHNERGFSIKTQKPTGRAPRILTPHPGEFARLRGLPTPPESDFENRRQVAADFARETNTVLVLKGHATIIADGTIPLEEPRIAVNSTGNPGMATGGSGDVLTGLIAAWVAQKFSPWDAARLGVYLHGLAGDFAAESVGEISVTATSLLDMLPKSIQTFCRSR